MYLPTYKNPQDNEENLSRDLFNKQMIRLQELFGISLSEKRIKFYWQELKPFDDRSFMHNINRIIANNDKFPFISDFGRPHKGTYQDFEYTDEYKEKLAKRKKELYG